MVLPPCVEEYVDQGNPVRAIDVYVDTVDLWALEFKNAQLAINAGQPPYDPAALLKLYLYGSSEAPAPAHVPYLHPYRQS
jgi:transposase